MFDLDKPVICAVNGMAVGGGFEIALCCDVIVADDHAQFFLPEVKVGVIPDGGGVFRLPRRVPESLALEMLLIWRPPCGAPGNALVEKEIIPGP